MGHGKKKQKPISVPGSSGGQGYMVGPQFCVPNNLELLITVSSRSKDGFKGFIVSDAAGAVYLRVKAKSGGVFSRPKQMVEDAYGNTILTLQPKAWSWHERHQAFRGNSVKTKNMLFSAKTTSMWRTNVHVFMASNAKESVPDFKLKSKSNLKECTLYSAGSNVAVAKINKQKKPFKLCGHEKDSWKLSSAPNVDYSFLVALFVMVAQIDTSVSNGRTDAAVAVTTATVDVVSTVG